MIIAVSSAFAKPVFVVLLSTLHRFLSLRQMITKVFLIRKGEWSSFIEKKIFFFYGTTDASGPGTLIVEASRSHSDTPHSVGLLWTSD
jgi:hypothetical protein